MNFVELRKTTRRWTLPAGIPLVAFAILLLAVPLAAAADDDSADADDIISLAAYNVKADRIEDFGLRVGSSFYSKQPKTTAGFFLAKFVPIITAIVPNTAAAKAGLQPGDRILKSEGQSTVGGLFSTGKLGKWHKIQKKKWAEVAAGKTNVTWTLEIETPATKAVRTVKLTVPTPPPHWGASVWRAPGGRSPGVVAEPGPLAELARAVLDHGIWILLEERHARVLGVSFNDSAKNHMPTGLEPTAYAWHIGNRQAGVPEGVHRIIVTQFRGHTDIFFETDAPWTGGIYLTTPSGALEMASQWPKGESPPEEARAGFEHELDFWTTKVARGTGRWPFDVQPGYDAKTMFSIPAPNTAALVTEVAPRPTEEFLKLPLATLEQRELYTEALGKIGADEGCWAYTETSRGLEDKRETVVRVDPSKPDPERCALLKIDGKSPTPAQVQTWRDEGRDVSAALGELPPIADLVDQTDMRFVADEVGGIVFELPLRAGNGDFPADKFQARFRVNKAQRAFEDFSVKLRNAVRVAGVVKVTDAGLEARFRTLDPALAPQPVFLKMGGGVRVLLVKFSRSFESTRTDFQRVEPHVEPDPADEDAPPLSISVPKKL